MTKEEALINAKEDNELIIKAREGDDSSRETLLRKYKSMVCSIIRPYYLNGGDDEDLIQEGLIAVNTAINNYSTDSAATFSTFCYKCVHNKIIDLIRQTDAIDMFEELEKDNSTPGSLEEDVIIKQLVEDIKNVVAGKGTKIEEVILQMFLEGESYKEIATKINKDTKFVDNKLQKIKKTLQKASKEWK